MRGPRYLFRFDDLCPQMDEARWRPWAELMERFGVKPLLGVVPRNEDPRLMRGEMPGFWEEMREWQARGAAIGLHGYRHVCRAQGRSLVPKHRWSEFAGVDGATQRMWIGEGMRLLRGEGLEATVWVAPRHGLDWETVAAVRDVGMGVVSDGFGERPYVERGVVWLPQQIAGPVVKADGLWTICLHTNTATDGELREMEGFLEQNQGWITSLEEVGREWGMTERSWLERARGWGAGLRMEMRWRVKDVLSQPRRDGRGFAARRDA